MTDSFGRDSRGRTRLFATALTIGAAVALAVPATAVPSGGVANDGVVSSGLLADQGDDDYWTPERMAAAIPAEVSMPAAPPGAGPQASKGEPVIVAATDPDEAVLDEESAGRSGGAKAAAPEGIATRVPRPYTNRPDRFNGKVFFHDVVTDKDMRCSATAVASTNRSVVLTAGHCVYSVRLNAQGGIEGGAYASRWVFIPAYSPTTPHAPLGKWRARTLFTTPGWANQRDFAQDVGAAVVGEVKGVRLTRKVGGQSVGFNLDRNQRWSAFGYPGEPPFDGERQWRCDSATHDVDAVTPGSPIRILCNMTAGVSGGGWFIDLRRGRGVHGYRGASK